MAVNHACGLGRRLAGLIARQLAELVGSPSEDEEPLLWHIRVLITGHRTMWEDKRISPCAAIAPTSAGDAG